MIDPEKKIKAFARLGEFLARFGSEKEKAPALASLNDVFYEKMEKAVVDAPYFNGWFTSENVSYAMDSWANALQPQKLTKWLEPYRSRLQEEYPPVTVTVIMAGNIPMVGFHDFLCVLMSGHRLRAKLSSSDRHFLPLIYQVLTEIEPAFSDMADFTDAGIGPVEAVIATGSNNSARYFEEYFGKYPHLIRKNRNGIAVLTGKESEEEMKALGEDIFRYFGLGCRNVAKIFVPKNYNFDHFFGGIFPFSDRVINHNKYANNYDYYRAIFMMNKDVITENGFLILKEDASLGSPVSVMFYEFYEDEKQLNDRLVEKASGIQCVVNSRAEVENSIPFGEAQHPELWDYADGVDTMEFLIRLGQGTYS